MSLDITKSVTLNGKSLEGTTSQGNMSASITKGQSLNINIYLNAPENLDMTSARTDVIQFIAQVFSNALQVAPPTKPTTSTSEDNTKSDTSSSSNKDTTSSKDTSDVSTSNKATVTTTTTSDK